MASRMDALGPGLSLRPPQENASVPPSDPMQGVEVTPSSTTTALPDLCILDLPSELIVSIFYQVPWRTMVRAGRTCRRLWSIAQHNGLWFGIAHRLLSLPRRVSLEEFNALDDATFADMQIGSVVESMLHWLGHSTRYMLTSLVGSASCAEVNNPRGVPPGHGTIRDFGMAMIDTKGEIDRPLSTTDLQADLMLAVTNQSIAFSTLLTRAIGALVSPLTKPNDSTGHRNEDDPMTLVLGTDETKSHYVLRMPIRRMLLDMDHIWRQFVRLCWMESMRQFEASNTIHNLSAFHNIKMRRLQSAEINHGKLTDIKKGSLRIDRFPSIINCPTAEAVEEFERNHPGGAMSCSVCKRVVSIGQSEGFINNTVSALMPFRCQQSIFCSSHCMMHSLKSYGKDQLLCANPNCRSDIPFSRAVGAHHQNSASKEGIPADWFLSSLKDALNLQAFSGELQFELSSAMHRLYVHGCHWWQLGKRFMYSKQFLLSPPPPPPIPPAVAAIIGPVAAPQLNSNNYVPNAEADGYSSTTFQHVAHFLRVLPETSDPTFVNGHLGTSTSVWEKRLVRYQLFAQNLSKDYREHIVGDKVTPAHRPPATKVIDIHRGQYIPLGTIGLGLPAVKAFFDIPMIEIDTTWKSVEYIQSHNDTERFVTLLNSLKFESYCTGSCRRGSNHTTRCLNKACRSVFDLEMAPLSLECYELVLIQIDAKDPSRTNEREKGYVCDEYCAQAYFDQCAKVLHQTVRSAQQTTAAAAAASPKNLTYKRQRLGDE